MKARVKLCSGEKMLYGLAVICLVLTMATQVFAGASVGNLSMSVEKLRFELKEQEKQNESLTMKVNELTSFDKVKEVVKEMGLAYNNDNIIIVND